jgi:hypothetical protein
MRTNSEHAIELQMSAILKFKYYRVTRNVKEIEAVVHCDYLYKTTRPRAFDIIIISAKSPKCRYVDEITISRFYGYQSNIRAFL